jgi:hypothetical protein
MSEKMRQIQRDEFSEILLGIENESWAHRLSRTDAWIEKAMSAFDALTAERDEARALVAQMRKACEAGRDALGSLRSNPAGTYVLMGRAVIYASIQERLRAAIDAAKEAGL